MERSDDLSNQHQEVDQKHRKNVEKLFKEWFVKTEHNFLSCKKNYMARERVRSRDCSNQCGYFHQHYLMKYNKPPSLLVSIFKPSPHPPHRPQSHHCYDFYHNHYYYYYYYYHHHHHHHYYYFCR